MSESKRIMNEYLNKVTCGDCLEVMKQIPDNSIDLICTDPPYQLSSTTKKRTDDIAIKGSDGKGNPFCRQQAQKGFMGKEWDVLPSIEIWQECLRVLKPGAFAFIMCCPRQDSLGLMIYRLAEAGFQTGFTSIYWCYASGFPKASNIGKMVDKKLGTKGSKIIEKKSDMFGEQEIEIKGEEAGSRGNTFPLEHDYDLRQLSSQQAKSLDGSYGGFQPKPAVEIILVVMKPLSEKTYVDQAMKNKKGITHLDDGRIPYKNDDDNKREGNEEESHSNIYGWQKGGIHKSGERNNSGRFPANLLVSDDVLDKQDDGTKPHPIKSNVDKYEGYGTITQKHGEVVNYGDAGSFSRYFSLDMWFKEKLKDLSPAVQKVFPFLIVPKASKGEKNEGLYTKEVSKKKQVQYGIERLNTVNNQKNNHPTCKPIKLMSYLITIGSREQDIIFDPFAGSCTTGVACIGLNRQYIMCEKEKEYFEIGKARLDYAKSQLSFL